MISQKMMSFLTNKCGIENFEDFDFKFGAISKILKRMFLEWKLLRKHHGIFRF